MLSTCDCYLPLECIPALEGRAIVNLQMSEFFAARQDITAAVAVQPTAELLTNRGVIHQVISIHYKQLLLFLLFVRFHAGSSQAASILMFDVIRRAFELTINWCGVFRAGFRT